MIYRMKSAVLCLLLLSTIARGDAEVSGVLSVTPVLEHASIAAEIRLGPGESLSGIRWFNNDGSVTFPNVLIMDTDETGIPDVTQTGVALADVTGTSSGWSQVDLAQPVSSATGIVHVVFELPENSLRTGEGLGSGAGIGYVANVTAARGYLSADGADWIRLRSDFAFAVEPVVTLARGQAAQSLSALRNSGPEGWWTHVQPSAMTDGGESSLAGTDEGSAPRLTSRERPLVAAPNPFNPRVSVYFYAAEAGDASVTVFDVRGRRVRTLHEGPVAVGEHQVVWTGEDDTNTRVASGVYFVRARAAGAMTKTIRIAIVR